MNILVVEDVRDQREALVKIIERNFIDSRVYSCESIKEAINIARNKKVDLFLLDIELVDGSGLELAKTLRKMEQYNLTGIVFITNNIIHIMEAFKEIHCYDFLVKPYNEDDVKKIVALFSTNNNTTDKDGSYIVVNVAGVVTTKVYCEDIIYIEYEDRNCIIRTKNGVVSAKGYGLNKLLKEIQDDNIIQCHKAFAVNKKYIEKVVKIQTKIMEIHFWNCKERVPLGYKYKDDIMERLK